MKSNLTKLQAIVAKQSLTDYCRSEHLSANVLLRVAHHELYFRDVLGKSIAKYTCPRQLKGLELAMTALKMEYRSTAHEPCAAYQTGWWYLPGQQEEIERARADHESQDDRFNELLRSWVPKNKRPTQSEVEK